MEDLAVFTALDHSGSFGKNLVKSLKNKCYLPAKCRSVWQKTVTSVLKMLRLKYIMYVITVNCSKFKLLRLQ